jgi:N-acetylglucosaminyldiphosphoundecaprenol N-acetyl-beta-D-mannosaminyltransferase
VAHNEIMRERIHQMTIPTSDILGVGVSAINMEMALNTIDRWMAQRTPRYVCVTSTHSIMECYDDPDVRDIYNAAGLVTPDGMPMVWLSRLNGYKHVDRVYGPDLMLEVCERSLDRGYSHFFYGGSETTLDLLACRLSEQFPRLHIVGTHAPPMRPLTPEEDNEIVRMINAAQPNIVWVGLGCPKQERWMAKHIDRLQAGALIGVGAAFDFHAGTKRQAPRWMQRHGMEMLFRVMSEPRRLWRRFLRNHPRFVVLTLLQLLSTRWSDLTNGRPGSLDGSDRSYDRVRLRS